MIDDLPVGPIAFQGAPGAYSHLACRTAFPDRETMPCPTFEAAIESVRDGVAALAMLPTENSLAGRVPDMHALLPESGLAIVGEHFQRVQHCLLGPKGATAAGIKRVHSHAVALGQVRALIHEMGAQSVIQADTAGAAALVALWNNPEDAAVASALAAEIYSLDILRPNVEDAPHNTTRFYVMARIPRVMPPDRPNLITSFVFRVRNVPAALYKALGGFATNGVNLTRLESYMIGGHFAATQFLVEIEGHPETRAVRLALEELDFFSREIRILGVYPAAEFRLAQQVAGVDAD